MNQISLFKYSESFRSDDESIQIRSKATYVKQNVGIQRK